MKRWLVFGCIIAMILPCFFISVSAANYDYMDYITNIRVDGDMNIVTVELPLGQSRFDIIPYYDGLQGEKETYIRDELKYPFSIYADSGISYDIYIQPNYGSFLKLYNIPDDTEINLWVELYSYDLETDVPGSTLKPAWDFTYTQTTSLYTYLDTEYKALYSHGGAFGLWEDLGGFEQSYYDVTALQDNNDDDPTAITGAAYVYPSLRFKGCKFNSSGSVGMHISLYEITLHIDTLIAGDGKYDELLDEINDALADQGKKIDKLTGAVEDLPNQIGDQFQNMQEEEKNEANSSGNGSVDDMIQIIPDYSTGFIQGVKNLAASMSYEGTECKLTMPALTIPALPGVTPAPITFMEEQVVDFEVWFQRMPSEIMAVTRALFDIAVVGFCFYEFYDLISQLANGARIRKKGS